MKSPAREIRRWPEMHREVVALLTALFERHRKPFEQARNDAREVMLEISRQHGGLIVLFSNSDRVRNALKIADLAEVRNGPRFISDLTQSLIERFLELGKDDDIAVIDACRAVGELCLYYGSNTAYVPLGESMRIAFRDDDIATGYSEGAKPNELARRHGMSMQAIYRTLKNKGIPLRGRVKNPRCKAIPSAEIVARREALAERQEEIDQRNKRIASRYSEMGLLTSAEQTKALAEEFKLSRGHVRRILKRRPVK